MERVCEDCGKPFDLPTTPEKANPLIRDKCIDCISILQRQHEETKKDVWF
jgi:hypothetical protein